MRTHDCKRFLLALLHAAAWSLLPAAEASAVRINMNAIPFLRLEPGWSSNVYNSETNEVSSPYMRAAPGLSLKFTTDDNVVFGITGAYERTWYSDSDARLADYNTLYFRLDSSGEIRIAENLSVVPSVYYVDTTDSSRRASLVPSGDTLLPPTTIINFGTEQSYTFGGGLDFSYRVNPTTKVGLIGKYGELRFKDATPGSGLVDSSTVDMIALVTHEFSPRTSAGIGVGGSVTAYGNDNTLNSYSFSPGITFRHQLSPAFSLDGVLAYSWIRQEVGTGIPDLSSSAPSGYVDFKYVSGTFRAGVLFSANYTGSSGYVGFTREYFATIAVSDEISSYWGWTISGTYEIDRSAFGEGLDVDTLHGEAGFRYQPWVWGVFNLKGVIDQQWSQGGFGADITAYSFFLGMTFSKEYKIF